MQEKLNAKNPKNLAIKRKKRRKNQNSSSTHCEPLNPKGHRHVNRSGKEWSYSFCTPKVFTSIILPRYDVLIYRPLRPQYGSRGRSEQVHKANAQEVPQSIRIPPDTPSI